MIRIDQIKVPEGSDIGAVYKKASKKTRIKREDINSLQILKKSTDARKKNEIYDVYSVVIKTALSQKEEENAVKKADSKDVRIEVPVKYTFRVPDGIKKEKRPVIAGFGPAGIFLAYLLSENGFRPIVVERGKDIENRKKDVGEFFETGKLDISSNAQFGEGGAGAFSDGKLNTLIKDEGGRCGFILETFVKFGADDNILYDAKPHLGTDRLLKIIPRIRKRIIKNGGEVRFESCLTGFEKEDGHISAALINGDERIETDTIFLCIGHSARDTFKMLKENGAGLEPKAFAAGLRVEHKREDIDAALQRDKASYKLTHKCSDKRGVYSFCMCPGGYVINSSSEEGMLCVNGMSYSGRNGENSNSAIVVTLSPEDFMKDDDPLSGAEFQRELERKAFGLCNGKIPYQRYRDFKDDKATKEPGRVRPNCKGEAGFANLRGILPKYIEDDIVEGMEAFGRKIKGFDDDDTLFAGVESRTSSPVRILRDETFQANIRGLYPVGEGAGYAGGIMSAAIDGMKAAEKYVNFGRGSK